ncbi:transmembrane anchor protein [Brevirhabdus pacifica]|uniref:Transmembrane anchor protein n=1 Tax=Brevirhabdus pacifica TaxID=1267768 RepID=A0A1U7DLE8_9RHOB|nr:transmembrane anchor protein [Brevirhabdus pacifica]APX90802.1 transmembrane anchor protein [Brevirhabdus pacifica]OWU79584.1 transmembrane anchor protein [Loktanella sp. 22II-4b]PJJ87313.1 hypothetical protein CLV77_1881 [Brevirhabdus pacifica]
MFNADKPSLENLPSKGQLLRSTLVAAGAAAVILVTVVLPAEYGIDPTRVGRVLGLTEMGEIKTQLAEEAEMDRQMATPEQQSSLSGGLFGLLIGAAHAQSAEAEPEADGGQADAWRDEVTFTLTPGASAEWKMAMEQGQTAEYRMVVTGGRVNFDLHGHGGGKSVTYQKGRGSTGEEGTITAEFDGQHGWFWRNRDSAELTVTVQVRGEYAEFKDAS